MPPGDGMVLETPLAHPQCPDAIRQTSGQPPGGMIGNVVSFSRFLKEGGIASHPAAVLDACRSLEAVDITDRLQVYWALRANFVTRREQKEPFDHLYSLFWEQGIRLLNPEPDQSGAQPRGEANGGKGGKDVDVLLQDRPASGGASSAERLVKKDLRHLLAVEHPAAQEALQLLLAKLRTRASRRTRPASHGREISFRHTFRKNAPAGRRHPAPDPQGEADPQTSPCVFRGRVGLHGCVWAVLPADGPCAGALREQLRRVRLLYPALPAHGVLAGQGCH